MNNKINISSFIAIQIIVFFMGGALLLLSLKLNSVKEFLLPEFAQLNKSVEVSNTYFAKKFEEFEAQYTKNKYQTDALFAKLTALAEKGNDTEYVRKLNVINERIDTFMKATNPSDFMEKLNQNQLALDNYNRLTHSSVLKIEAFDKDLELIRKTLPRFEAYNISVNSVMMQAQLQSIIMIGKSIENLEELQSAQILIQDPRYNERILNIRILTKEINQLRKQMEMSIQSSKAMSGLPSSGEIPSLPKAEVRSIPYDIK